MAENQPVEYTNPIISLAKRWNLLNLGFFSYPIRFVSYLFVFLSIWFYYDAHQQDIPFYAKILMYGTIPVPHVGIAAYILTKKNKRVLMASYLLDSLLSGFFIVCLHFSYVGLVVIILATTTSNLALKGPRFAIIGALMTAVGIAVYGALFGFYFAWDSPLIITQMGAIYLATHILIFGMASYYFTENTSRSRNHLARQNNLISKQNKELQRQKEEIESRIKYARNIQEIMLPSERVMQKVFRDFLVYYVPKEVVSGDFYWLKYEENMVYVACVDCTGHGVPGAFMSMISYQLLDEIVGSQKMTNPVYIFDELNREIQSRLRQEKSENNDGLAISLCKIDLEKRKLWVGGSYHTVMLYNHGEWHEIKTTRKQIGGNFVNKKRKYSIFEADLSEDAVIYMFTDGIPDQFIKKGDDLEKFGKNRLYEFLKEHVNESFTTQNIAFMNLMENWMGDSEQTDDMTLMGIKV